jgi:P2X purinoceptor 4
VYLKVKGTGWSASRTTGSVTWDANDIVVPPTENGAVFITTNFLATYAQARTVFLGVDPATERCTKEKPCPEKNSPTKNGLSTGTECDLSVNATDPLGYCRINGWYPPEQNADPENYIEGIENFTLFFRETVRFPSIMKHLVLSNSARLPNGSASDLPVLGVDLLRVGDVLAKLNLTILDVRKKGIVIGVRSTWDCDFDKGTDCRPVHTFERLDNPRSHESVGFNFRDETLYWVPPLVDPRNRTGSTQYRNLVKRFGIRMIFTIGGTGGKFNTIPLLTNLGVGLGLLSVATVVADLIALTCMPQRNFYRATKYDDVTDPASTELEEALLPHHKGV